MTFSISKVVRWTCLLLSPCILPAAQLTIAWDDNSTGETGFKVERSTDSVTFVQVGTVGANVVSFIDTSVVSGTSYSYRVAAYDNVSTSAYSNVKSVTTPPAATMPLITTQPVSSQTVSAGGNVVLSVAASGVPAPTLQWKKNGVAIAGATGATYSLQAVTTSDAGTYSVVASNSVGSATSNNALIAISTPVAPPVGSPAPSGTPGTSTVTGPSITAQPTDYQSVNVGSTVSLIVSVTGSPLPTVQWKKDGFVIPGATNAKLTLSDVTALDAATYTVVATNTGGAVTSDKSVLAVKMLAGLSSPAPSPSDTPTSGNDVLSASDSSEGPSRLMNLSVRSIPGPDERALLVGFVVKGGSKSMLVRAVGPGLATYTDTQVFQNPKISVYTEGTVFATNDDWGGSEKMKSDFARLGAFPLPGDSKDAAVLSDFSPRAYTANVTGPGTGLAMAEVYDADASSAPLGRLVNLSARAHASSGSGVLIIGFVISGDEPLKVLLRAIGPTLLSRGLSSAMIDPKLEVFRGNTRVQHNDNWEGSSELTAAFTQVGAFALPDLKSKDAAMIVTLEPGAYTAIVSGVGGTEGVALAEVYELR